MDIVKVYFKMCILESKKPELVAILPEYVKDGSIDCYTSNGEFKKLRLTSILGGTKPDECEWKVMVNQMKLSGFHNLQILNKVPRNKWNLAGVLSNITI